MKQSDPQIYQRELAAGTLTITTQSRTDLTTLFDVAARKNPKRAFLFVSKVLGRHIPVSPSIMQASYLELASRLPRDLPEPVLFIGMAETAVGLAAGIYREAHQHITESVLITSTRHPVEGELLCEFTEDHSHATDHLIYLPENATLRARALNARTLVLIDDEATTGNTFLNLLSALRNAGVDKVTRVVTVTLTDWSNGVIRQKTPLPVDIVALVAGTWQWVAKPHAPIPVMPSVNITASGSVSISARQDWGRLGMQQISPALGLTVQSRMGEKILVLGSGEFIWQPFLLAERLEQEGAVVKFSSLTRSPIAQGMAIQSTIAFTDNYGLGIPNFVYNVAHQQFDRVLVCVETPAASVCPDLLAQLQKTAAKVEVISYE